MERKEISEAEIETDSSDGANLWDDLDTEVPFAGDVDDEKAAESSEKLKIPDLPETSKQQTCRFYLREIARSGRMEDVKDFIQTALSSEHKAFSEEAELDAFCDNYAERMSSTLSADEQSALMNYTGFNYKYINQIARGQWSYDLLGPKTDEKVTATKQTINEMKQAIYDAPTFGVDFVAYRGTNLDSFLGYDVDSVSDLSQLKNQFFLESGFTSTSIDKQQSFMSRKEFDDPQRRGCNIAIEYLISGNDENVAGLFSEATHYNPESREVLINNNSLSYITDVKVDEETDSAILKMVLVPRQIYDPSVA